MTNIYVQFADSSETTVVAYFSCAQDPNQWPNQGVLASNDARWATYYNAQLPALQRGLPAPSA